MVLKKKSNWPPPARKETIKVKNGRRYKVVKADCPEWLPTNWVIERRIRKSGTKMGMEYKCFIDPSTEAKFFSKPEVLRYLKSKQCSAGSSRRKNKGFIDQPSVLKSNLVPEVPQVMKTRALKRTPSRKVKFVLERTSDEELPSGWIKETKIKMRGDKVLRRDSYFLDPVSTMVFQSKLQALRFVETGEISRYAYRRRNQNSVGKYFSEGNTSVVVERTSDEELPSGWIKETKSKMLGNKVLRRDSYFLDPSSRLVFQSKLEALHYVGTGEISRYARRRRNQIRVGIDFAAGNSSTSSGKLEEALDRKATKQLFTIEGCSGPSIQVLPEAGVIEEAGSRKRKSSSRVRKPPSAGASTRKRNTVSSREAADVTKCTPVEVQDTDVKYAFPRKGEPFSSPSTGVLLLESPGAVSIQDGNGGKTHSSKKKTKNMKLPYVPSRSSKRLAGVDAELVFHRIPIEYALRPTSPSSVVKPLEGPVAVDIQDGNSGKSQISKKRTKNVKLPYVPSRSSKRIAGVDAEVVFHRIPVEHALQSTTRKMSRTKPVSCLGSVPNELHQMHQDVDRKNLKEDVHHATSRKSGTVESVLKECHEQRQALDTKNELTSQEVIHHPVDLKTDVLAAQGEQPLEKVDGPTFQEKMHRTDIMLATLEEQPSNRVDDLTFLDKQRYTLDINLLPNIGESLNKIDDVPFQEEKQFTLDLNTTVHATRGEPWNNIDKLAKKPILVDLNDLQLEAPPGFSENTKQSSEHPTDTLLRNKGKNVPNGQTMLEDRSHEQLTCIDKQTEQPQFESCFSASLWSDPCLDFAFKTLTGVIPIDDNMAIQDYIQQQIRTSEPSPRNDKNKGSSPANRRV